MDTTKRDAFIEEAINDAITAGRPLLAFFARKESYQNFCEIFREDKREEGAYVASACLAQWKKSIANEFKRYVKAARYAHIFDLDTPEGKRDIAARMEAVMRSEQD